PDPAEFSLCWKDSGVKDRAGARGLARAHHRLQIIVGLDDLDQAILGRAVAAIGVRVMLLHQRLVLHLDVFQRRLGAEPHHLQRLALGIEYLASLGLGFRAWSVPPAAAAV